MKALKLMLVGEGSNELGSWARHESYRDASNVGVLEALLQCLRADGWVITCGKLWKERPTTYRTLTGTPERVDPEQHKVLALTLDAIERGCDGLVFLRDSDGDKKRSEAIRTGLERARERAPLWAPTGLPVLRIAGAAAVPTLEAWLLALAGRHKTETMSRTGAQAKLEALGVGSKSTLDMREWVKRYGVASIAPDAASLIDWVAQARLVLHCQEPSE